MRLFRHSHFHQNTRISGKRGGGKKKPQSYRIVGFIWWPAGPSAQIGQPKELAWAQTWIDNWRWLRTHCLGNGEGRNEREGAQTLNSTFFGCMKTYVSYRPKTQSDFFPFKKVIISIISLYLLHSVFCVQDRNTVTGLENWKQPPSVNFCSTSQSQNKILELVYT